VNLTGAQSYAIQCTGGCSPSILSLKDNVVQATDRIGYADAAFDEGYNVYWRPGGSPLIWFPYSSTSKVADPMFVAPASNDLRLNAGSPAVDTGSRAGLTAGFTADVDGVALPQGTTTDRGAEERTPGAPLGRVVRRGHAASRARGHTRGPGHRCCAQPEHLLPLHDGPGAGWHRPVHLCGGSRRRHQ